MTKFGIGLLDDFCIKKGILIVELRVEVDLAVREDERLGKFLC